MTTAVKILGALLIVSTLWGIRQSRKNRMEWFEVRYMRENVIRTGFGVDKLEDDLRECRSLLHEIELDNIRRVLVR